MSIPLLSPKCLLQLWGVCCFCFNTGSSHCSCVTSGVVGFSFLLLGLPGEIATMGRGLKTTEIHFLTAVEAGSLLGGRGHRSLASSAAGGTGPPLDYGYITPVSAKSLFQRRPPSQIPWMYLLGATIHSTTASLAFFLICDSFSTLFVFHDIEFFEES